MLEGYHPLVQSLLGTFLTWGLTAAGSALVFLFQGNKEQRRILDGSLGFAAGVMLAASYWSLLAPAIEMAESSGLYGSFTFLPISFGFVVGALFVYMADLLLPLVVWPRSHYHHLFLLPVYFLEFLLFASFLALMFNDDIMSSSEWVGAESGVKGSHKVSPALQRRLKQDSISDAEEGEFVDETEIFDIPERQKDMDDQGSLRSRAPPQKVHQSQQDDVSKESKGVTSWRRILLLIIAITVHNIPEGLAVGVGFGAVGKSASATLESARNLAIGIGIQNFPEGLAVSLPLRAAGMDIWKSFWYGQLSGMVEPVAGILGTAAVVLVEPLLPYALAFAAGAMVFVVVDDIIPESYSFGNGRLSSFGAIVGFVIMMSLDVGLG